jgi:TrmH family RNA methyltransferase
MIIDGVREIGRALDAGVELTELFVCPTDGLSQGASQLVRQAADRRVEILEVSSAIMDKLAFGHRRDGVVAVARTPPTTLQQLPLPDAPLIVVLEGVEKPGNVGAVIRTADGAGADAVLICDGGTDLYNPHAIRASLGTIFSTPLATATTAEAVAWVVRVVDRVLVARVDGQADYAQVDYTGAVAIVLGSEATGLSDAWKGDSTVGVQLPMRGMADSLNVSSAAAVLLYQAQQVRTRPRQRV